MRFILILISLCVLGVTSAVRAEFSAEINLDLIRTATIQHSQTLKTLDSFARQAMSQITGKSRIDGQDPLFSLLDISFRPEQYLDRPLIKVRHRPLLEELARIEGVSEEEAGRMLREQSISYHFVFGKTVMRAVESIKAADVRKGDAINQLFGAVGSLDAIMAQDYSAYRIVAPATTLVEDHTWHSLVEVNAWGKALGEGSTVPQLAAYGERRETLGNFGEALLKLRDAWRNQDAVAVNVQLAALSKLLPAINPNAYPSQVRRSAEVTYNRLAKLTVPGAFVYFFAFVMFLMSARSGVGVLRLWAIRFFIVAFLIHTAGIGIRWWLIEKSLGSWFDAIPIKNQFESVLFSAWFGALVGLILELRKSRGIFGAAAAFVGWLSLIAIFSVPYVFGREIGGEIGQVQGVLMSYWLYIHVTTVVASYALIGMSFLLGVWWLVRYYSNYGTFRQVPSRQLSGDAARDEIIIGLGGAGALSFGSTLARVLFLRAGSKVVTKPQAAVDSVAAREEKVGFLATLDLCNLVVLQLAFWVLGFGIICGAIWADESWGRPWGWDPKETFALVTFIVYLIVVHIRMVTADKAWWTSVLAIIGFFVMLFNWIGVNFFLTGLHSYA